MLIILLDPPSRLPIDEIGKGSREEKEKRKGGEERKEKQRKVDSRFLHSLYYFVLFCFLYFSSFSHNYPTLLVFFPSLNSMQRIWFRKASLSVATKMKLYNSCVQPRMMYNAGASAYTRVELDKLDAAHRRHLRRILGVFYPEHITNEETYRRTEARPISIDVVEKRWTLLGHTLRLAKDTTGNKVITQYFQNKIAGANEERKLTRRGRVLTTLPRLLQRDLREKLTVHERRTHFNVDDLENGRRIEILRRTAVNRSKWRRGVEAMVEKEHTRWTKRNTEKSRKRAAEKITYERRKREEEARKRQRTTETNGGRMRTIQQYFR